VVRIEIKDFQSIDHEVIEVDGFSALAGRSNIGKSAVVRAIKAALTGPPVEGYVRHGIECPRTTRGAKSCKCFCSVHIVTEGLDLLWEKGDAVNRYKHNGEEYTAVGGGTPEFLMEGFAPIKIGDDKELVQVSDQFRPIFILDKPGTVAADILSDVAKLDQINVAIRLVEKDRKDARTTRRIREKDVLSLQTELSNYEGLDDAVGQVSALEELDLQVESINVKVKQLEQFIESVLSTGSQIKTLKGVSLIEVPAIAPLTDEGSRFVKLKEFVEELEDRSASVLSLDGLETIEVPDFEILLVSDELRKKLIQWVSKFDLLRDFFTQFQALERVPVPVLDLLKNARDNYFGLVSWASRLIQLSQTLVEVKEELGVAIKEEADILEEFKVLGMCPTCNHSFMQVCPMCSHSFLGESACPE
jgi:hypothetical protein